ncbi:MAG: hypothetical protein IJN85_03590, partial [Oscillospiraceae bacterium]|nr:hypothetical protein [Oscillospiraceae bacterium]
MKKILSLFLAVAVIFSCITVVFAADAPVLEADNSKVDKNKVSVTISLKDEVVLSTLYFDVVFDSTVIELLEVECE